MSSWTDEVILYICNPIRCSFIHIYISCFIIKKVFFYTFAFPLAQMQLSSEYKPSLHLKNGCCVYMYLYPRIITTLSYFHNYHTMKLIRQLDVSLNVILYPEAQNYENHFKVGGSQTPGLSSKSQVNKTTCRCSTGHSQIW